MQIQLPQQDSLNTNILSRVFKNTVATYKYYWFLSILEIILVKKERRIIMWDIIISMIAKAWYPIHYFKLSFGKNDSMFDAIRKIQSITLLPIDADKQSIEDTLKFYLAQNNKDIRKQLSIFTMNVPYRFLSPWIHTSNNNEMMFRSQTYENDALYALIKDEKNEMYIEINPRWMDYLVKNHRILQDFTYWNLTNFLQVRNPNVPNISNKLIRPEQRRSLTKQHHFWDKVIEYEGSISCIYTDVPLYKHSYDLDHFIPWSFVTHDLIWNLIPSNPSVNSSKSDKIPDLNFYLPKLVNSHYNALKVLTQADCNDKILEDYLSLGYSIPDLLSMNQNTFYQVFYHTFSPIAQIALNMGFEEWKYQ